MLVWLVRLDWQCCCVGGRFLGVRAGVASPGCAGAVYCQSSLTARRWTAVDHAYLRSAGRCGRQSRPAKRRHWAAKGRAEPRAERGAAEPVIHRFFHTSELSVEKFSLQSEPGRILSG